MSWNVDRPRRGQPPGLLNDRPFRRFSAVVRAGFIRGAAEAWHVAARPRSSPAVQLALERSVRRMLSNGETEQAKIVCTCFAYDPTLQRPRRLRSVRDGLQKRGRQVGGGEWTFCC